MATYKLLAGKYVNGTRVYRPGDEVVSDDDLVKIGGREKFSVVPPPVYIQVPAPEVEKAPDDEGSKKKGK